MEEKDFVLSTNYIDSRIKTQLYGDKIKYWKYDYEEYYPDNKYNIKDFEIKNDRLKNFNKSKKTNFELTSTYGKNSYYIAINKIMLKAIGIENALYLTEVSRLSMNLPVNKWGFFEATRTLIESDTGLSDYHQRKAEKFLVQNGFINFRGYKTCATNKNDKSYKNRNFIRFNDEFTTNEFKTWRHQYNSGMEIKTDYIGLNEKKGKNKNGIK